MDKQMDKGTSIYIGQAEKYLAAIASARSNRERHQIFRDAADNYFRAGEYELAIECRMNEAECAYNFTERASANYYAGLACEKMEQWDRAANFYVTGIECLSTWIEKKNADPNSDKSAVLAMEKRRINTLTRAGECLNNAGNLTDAHGALGLALGLAQKLNLSGSIDIVLATIEKCGFQLGKQGQGTDFQP